MAARRASESQTGREEFDALERQLEQLWRMDEDEEDDAAAAQPHGGEEDEEEERGEIVAMRTVAGRHFAVINNPDEEDPAKREYEAEIVGVCSEEGHHDAVLYEAAEEGEDWPGEAEWEGVEWPEEVDPWGAEADAGTTTNAAAQGSGRARGRRRGRGRGNMGGNQVAATRPIPVEEQAAVVDSMKKEKNQKRKPRVK